MAKLRGYGYGVRWIGKKTEKGKEGGEKSDKGE
jgi:hypothetical protein